MVGMWTCVCVWRFVGWRLIHCSLCLLCIYLFFPRELHIEICIFEWKIFSTAFSNNSAVLPLFFSSCVCVCWCGRIGWYLLPYEHRDPFPWHRGIQFFCFNARGEASICANNSAGSRLTRCQNVSWLLECDKAGGTTWNRSCSPFFGILHRCCHCYHGPCHATNRGKKKQ